MGRARVRCVSEQAHGRLGAIGRRGTSPANAVYEVRFSKDAVPEHPTRAICIPMPITELHRQGGNRTRMNCSHWRNGRVSAYQPFDVDQLSAVTATGFGVVKSRAAQQRSRHLTAHAPGAPRRGSRTQEFEFAEWMAAWCSAGDA